jgi:hypothetical protein
MSTNDDTNVGGALEALLDQELSFEATTGRGLTNHLPMALVAKAGLGAPEDELSRFAATYRDRLVACEKSSTQLTTATWQRAIGQSGSFDDLRDYFERQIHEYGIEATLRGHLDQLIPGIHGAAFHGAIRLAYALEVASPLRVAAGIAYLAETAVALGELPVAVTAGTDDPASVLSAMAASGHFASLPSQRLISDEMQQASHVTEFHELLAHCAIIERTPDLLRSAALHLFASTGDFTSLHAVTGMEAFSKLRPFVSDNRAFDTSCLVGLAAAYATVGAPRLASGDYLNELVASNTCAAPEISQVGAMSDDEHVSKLVYSALRLYAETDDSLYLTVAARKAGLLS